MQQREIRATHPAARPGSNTLPYLELLGIQIPLFQFGKPHGSDVLGCDELFYVRLSICANGAAAMAYFIQK
jgi:hypothetical protein